MLLLPVMLCACAVRCQSGASSHCGLTPLFVLALYVDIRRGCIDTLWVSSPAALLCDNRERGFGIANIAAALCWTIFVIVIIAVYS